MFEHVTFVIFLCDVIKLCNIPYLAQSLVSGFVDAVAKNRFAEACVGYTLKFTEKLKIG